MARKQKKKNNTKVLWSWIIILLMVSSVFGIMFGSFASSNEKITYKDFKFERIDDQWVTEIDDKEYSFSYSPNTLENLSVDAKIIDRLKNTYMMYFTSSPDDKYKTAIASFEYSLGLPLAENMNKYVYVGMTANNTYGMPIITCMNATSTVPVLKLMTANSTKIYLEDDCIIAQTSSEYQYNVMRDRILYSILGII